MSYASNIAFLARHMVRQLLVAPQRKRQWRAKRMPFTSTRAGLTFELFPGQYVDKHIFVDGIYEDRLLPWLKRTLRGGVMLDVGANIGNHALYLSRLFDTIHCFEPNPTACDRLRHNVALNDAANIVVHEVGLGAADALLPFEEVGHSLGRSHFVETPTARSRYLQVVRGDPYVAGLALPSVDFIKIDVEGFEPQVLEGLADTIARHRPIVSFEYHGQLMDPASFEVILEVLRGYRIVEPILEPGAGSYLQKALFYLAHATQPELQSVAFPEARPYPYLMAFPDG